MTSADTTNQIATAPPLVDLVLLCQQSYRAWVAATDPGERELYGVHQRAYTEQLWLLLAEDLLVMARSWLRSGMASDHHSYALHLFSCLLFELPRLVIDPARNVRNFLLTVARRGIITEYRKLYPAQSRQQRAQPQPSDVQSSNFTRMWNVLSSSSVRSIGSPLEELADPHSYDAETLLIKQIDQRELLKKVWGYWEEQLSLDDLRIMRLRYGNDPPLHFEEIAHQMGQGWTSEAVRQRHHRAKNATRAYLKRLGWLDDEQE